MDEIVFKPIGVIRSPHQDLKGTPIQPAGAQGIEGTVEVLEQYAEGLKDLEGFSKIILLYHFHLAGEPRMTVVPFMDDKMHGVFATRAPREICRVPCTATNRRRLPSRRPMPAASAAADTNVVDSAGAAAPSPAQWGP